VSYSGRMLFPLNIGVSETEITISNGSNVYTDRNSTNNKAKAFKNVSVNPTLYTAGLENETDYKIESNTNPFSSIIHTEIRKAPRKDGTVQTKIVATTNKETTPSFKVKIYDSNFADETVNNIATNLRATYHPSSDFPTDRVGLDIEDYDYFIILNHDILDTASGKGVDSVNAHFAKVTRIVSFDEFGDGVEFSPKYNGDIPKGTTFEIYKGAAKTDTDLVAVSYGLRGDNSATTDKYDKICNVNTPTFYFYNDRLKEKDQLDYNEKYTVTSTRVWDDDDVIVATDFVTAGVPNGSITQYEVGSTGKYFIVSSDDYDKLQEGMAIFNGTNYLGNVELKYTVTSYHRFYLDFYRHSTPLAATNVNFNLRIGTTIQNVVFKTESKYNNTIQNLGRNNLDAILVDNTLIDDEDDSNFDPLYWNKAFPLMKRSLTDANSFSGNVWTNSENLNGAIKYITFESAQLKNDKIPTTLDTIVNNPKNKMSKMATVVTLDNSGTQHLKVKEDSKMVVRNGLYSDTLKLKKIEHTVSSSSNTITINGLTGEYDYASILADNTIVEIDGYHYIIASVSTRNYTLTTQTFTIDARKTVNSSVFVGGSTVHSFSSVDCYVVPYSNNKLNVEFAADTEVRHDQSDRLTLENRTVEVKNTKLYNARLSITNKSGHDVRVNYGDRTHKYLTILDSTKQYYQKTPISRMYYYNGSYTLNEEVFNGNVEDIESKNESGMMTYTISGRDEIANLLTTTVNKNLNFTDDIVYSTLNPHIDNFSSPVNSDGAVTKDVSTSITIDGAFTFKKYMLFFNSSYELIGEYSSSTQSGIDPNTTTTIILKDKAYVSSSNNTNIYYYNPLDTSSRFISGVKALATNVTETTRPTDFTNTSEKGLVFNEGLNFTYNSTYNTFTYLDLKLTSNNGSFEIDGSYGYDILKPSNIVKRIKSDNSIVDEDMPSSTYLLKIGKEKETNIEYTQKNIVSSEMFHVVDVNDVNDSKNIVTIAPNFPVVLGTQDNNSTDTRFLSSTNSDSVANYHAGFYLLNSNLHTGGFIHKFKSQFQHYFAPEDTFKFVDLQSFSNNTLIPYDNYTNSWSRIYQNANRKHKIKGYTTGVKLLPNGTRDSRTTNASDLNWFNRADGTKNVDTTIFDSNLSDDTNIKDLVTNDWRARPYSLYATGDLYPSSKLRFNNLSFSNNSLSDYGLLFEDKGTKGTQVNHNHIGKTQSTIRDDNDYELSEIQTATKTTNQIKRWGIVRLVEATFDWHFNSVDAESVKGIDEIDEIDIPRYIKYNSASSPLSASDLTSYNLLTQKENKMDKLLTVIEHVTNDNRISQPLNMTRIYMLTPNFTTNYFDYALLSENTDYGGNTQSGNATYDPPNILLPLISEGTLETLGSFDIITSSAFHLEKITSSSNTIQRKHVSKVLSALSKPYTPNHSSIDDVNPYGINWPSKDIYDNCTAIFKDMKSSKDGSSTTLDITSSPLELDVFPSLHSELGARLENGQPTGNIIENKATNNVNSSKNMVFIGTKTRHYPFDSREGYTISTTTEPSHADSAGTNGEMYSAQMFLKPQFNITTASSAITSVQFTMNTSSTHHWLNFVPNLTGYYIVSNRTINSANHFPTSETLSGSQRVVSKGTPNYIGKILSHTVSGQVHTLTFDKAILNSTDGTYFRLMRLSDTVFEETPDYFEVNVMQDSGLDYNTVPKNLRTGDVSSKNQFGEGIYSMYMLLNIDETNTYLERRDLANISSSLFSNGDEINCYITDGNNSQTKSLTITFDDGSSDANNRALKFEYDGELNGDGCVSFGETIDVTIPKKLSIIPTKCYLGTTFSIGGIVENEIENIAKEAELDVNYEQSLRDYTTNLVDRNTDGSAKITGNVITCVEKPIDVIVGDVLYTQEGYLVGKVTSISNITITIDGIIFVPSAYDELIRRQRKTHVSNVRFEDTDSFSAINFLANKRGLDYKISNGEIIAKNIEDVHGLRKYSINYKSGHNLVKVESNKSLFDKANKVIVIGDGVKAEAEMPTKGRTRTIRHIDSSIKSLSDAKIKAHQLLQIHNADVRKIKLKIQKEGLELLEAGDILTLDFPNHDIPINDYQVFEIENILSGVATITVGTFNKTIAERLGELSSTQTRSTFTLFGKNSVQSVVGKSVFDSFSIKNNTIEYKISTTNSNLGFNNILGFTTLLGFGSGSTTLKTYKSEKDV